MRSRSLKLLIAYVINGKGFLCHDKSLRLIVNLVTRLENVNTSDKETQIDHISMLKEYDLIRYQQQHPDQYRPYGKCVDVTFWCISM